MRIFLRQVLPRDNPVGFKLRSQTTEPSPNYHGFMLCSHFTPFALCTPTSSPLIIQLFDFSPGILARHLSTPIILPCVKLEGYMPFIKYKSSPPQKKISFSSFKMCGYSFIKCSSSAPYVLVMLCFFRSLHIVGLHIASSDKQIGS